MQISTKNIIIAIVVVTLIFVIVAFFVFSYVTIYNQRKKKDADEKKRMESEFEKQLLQSQIEVQETTMSVVGRELHDNIGQLLSTTKMLLGITEMNMVIVPDTFTTAQATISKAIVELRSLSRSLDKEWLEQFDFIENIKNEIARINATKELYIHFKHSEDLSLGSEKQIMLFRIVQEAVQNSIKHAQARNIYIDVTESKNLIVSIIDDGIGTTKSEVDGGMGLFNMKQRTKLLGGSITWNSVEGSGTRVEIQLPLN